LKQGGPERDIEFKVTNNVLVQGDPRLLLIVIENLLGMPGNSLQSIHTRGSNRRVKRKR